MSVDIFVRDWVKSQGKKAVPGWSFNTREL